MTPRGFLCLILGCGLWIASTALACKVPVFRYALERWSVDRYRIVAIIDDDSRDAAGDALNRLRADVGTSLNADIEVVDVSKLSEDQLWQLEGSDGEVAAPQLQVFFPERNGRRKKCWEGELTSAAVEQWIDSPLRRQIAADIADGVSAVWLLVDGSDAAENQRVAQQIDSALESAAATIQIPEGVIARDDASGYLREHPDASMDDVLRSDVPLRVDFRLRRLSRDDPDETALRMIITAMAGPTDRPLIVPVFGRGRMLDVMEASGSDEQTVMNVCNYIVGECSCTVKSLNPGVDLLLQVDWPERLGSSVIVVDSMDQEISPKLVPIPQGEVVGQSPPSAQLAHDGVSVISLILVGLAIVGLAVVGLAVVVIGRRIAG